MNFSTILGFLGAAGILGYAIYDAKGASAVLLNLHGIMIVLGGTAAAAIISFPIKQVVKLSLVTLKRLIVGGSVDYSAVINEVISIAEGLQRDTNYAKGIIGNLKNPFLKEGVQLIINGANEEQMVDILRARIDTFKRRQNEEVVMFKTLAKFPPAFGLLGTTFGMIALLNQLGSPDAQKMIGPSMAIGLVATLYGIALANFIFIPISENLNAMNGESHAARRMILEALILIKRKTHPIFVEEKMKSFLLPAERQKLKGGK